MQLVYAKQRLPEINGEKIQALRWKARQNLNFKCTSK